MVDEFVLKPNCSTTNVLLFIKGWYILTYTGLGNETGKFQNIRKNRQFFICLLVINEKHMNSHFVLCHFENLCFESNALKMASVLTDAFLKSGPETLHDPLQHIHRNCSHFILNSLF